MPPSFLTRLVDVVCSICSPDIGLREEVKGMEAVLFTLASKRAELEPSRVYGLSGNIIMGLASFEGLHLGKVFKPCRLACRARPVTIVNQKRFFQIFGIFSTVFHVLQNRFLNTRVSLRTLASLGVPRILNGLAFTPFQSFRNF